jgi:hypothetical protein
MLHLLRQNKSAKHGPNANSFFPVRPNLASYFQLRPPQISPANKDPKISQKTNPPEVSPPVSNTRQNNRQKRLVRSAKNETFYRVCLYILRDGKNSPKIAPLATGKNRGNPRPCGTLLSKRNPPHPPRPFKRMLLSKSSLESSHVDYR